MVQFDRSAVLAHAITRKDECAKPNLKEDIPALRVTLLPLVESVLRSARGYAQNVKIELEDVDDDWDEKAIAEYEAEERQEKLDEFLGRFGFFYVEESREFIIYDDQNPEHEKLPKTYENGVFGDFLSVVSGSLLKKNVDISALAKRALASSDARAELEDWLDGALWAEEYIADVKNKAASKGCAALIFAPIFLLLFLL